MIIMSNKTKNIVNNSITKYFSRKIGSKNMRLDNKGRHKFTFEVK